MQLTDEKYEELKTLLAGAWDADKRQFNGRSLQYSRLIYALLSNAPEIIADLAEQHPKPTPP